MCALGGLFVALGPGEAAVTAICTLLGLVRGLEHVEAAAADARVGLVEVVVQVADEVHEVEVLGPIPLCRRTVQGITEGPMPAARGRAPPPC